MDNQPQSKLSAAMLNVDRIEAVGDEMDAELSRVSEGVAKQQQTYGSKPAPLARASKPARPTVLLKEYSDQCFHRVAECGQAEVTLEDARGRCHVAVDLKLNQKKAVISAELTRLTIERNRLDDQIASQKAAAKTADNWATENLESIDRHYDLELEANARIKAQMLAALVTDTPKSDPDFREIEVPGAPS